MSLFVDTSVWSLAFRRDSPGDAPEPGRLREALASREAVYTTGLILQGFRGPTARDAIVERFASLPMIRREGLQSSVRHGPGAVLTFHETTSLID